MRVLLCQFCSNAMGSQLFKEPTLSKHFQLPPDHQPAPAEKTFATERMLPQRRWQMHLVALATISSDYPSPPQGCSLPPEAGPS